MAMTEAHPIGVFLSLPRSGVTAIKLRNMYVWSKTALAVLKHNS
jgi:hypothetical protein